MSHRRIASTARDMGLDKQLLATAMNNGSDSNTDTEHRRQLEYILHQIESASDETEEDSGLPFSTRT